MAEKTGTKTYKVSAHARERYAERIMGRDCRGDISRYVLENGDKICTDINKMTAYGELIYSGRQLQKDGKGNMLEVYVKDTWVILADPKAETIITLYKIDLGCGDDFNLQYIGKMKERIAECNARLEAATAEAEAEADTYRGLLDDAQCQMAEYRKIIKNLEELCEGYRMVISNSGARTAQAGREAAECVNTLIGKKTF